MHSRRVLRVALAALMAVSLCPASLQAGAPQEPGPGYSAPTRSRLLDYLEILVQYRDGQRQQALERLAAFPDRREAVLELVSFPSTLQRLKRKVVDAHNERAAGGRLSQTYDVAAFIADPEASEKSGWGRYRTLAGEWAVYTLPEIQSIAWLLGYPKPYSTINPYLRLAAFVHNDFAQDCWPSRKDFNLAEAHWELAGLALRPLETLEAERRYVRTWYLAAVAGTLRNAAFAETAFFLEKAGRLLPDDPDLALAHGCLCEALAMLFTRTMTIPGKRALRVKSPAENLVEGEQHLRRAVALGAGPAARLHLGHVLVLQGRPEDALAELAFARTAVAERAHAGTSPQLTSDKARIGRGEQEWALRYQLLLVQGMALEAAGETTSADRAYAGAAAMYPAAQAPFLARSHLHSRDAASPRAATAALDAALHIASNAIDRDPWWSYRYGNAWDLDQMHADLMEIMFR